MKSIERVLTTLSHKEADRVPMFLLLTMHGAKYKKMSFKEYYDNPKAVAEAQLYFHEKYNNDILYSFYYASIECQAFGGSIVFREDGPTNAGNPFIKSFEDIDKLQVPDVENNEHLGKVYETIRYLAEAKGGEVLIAGVVMSPYSTPVMQMGMENYMRLKIEDPERFKKLMEINTEFCIRYANEMIKNGANAIVYFDPIASPTVSTRKEFEEAALPIMKECIEGINGPLASHYASGIVLPIIDDLIEAGVAAVGTSSKEDHVKIKEKAKGKITIIGNLNGIEMYRWTKEDVKKNVKNIVETCKESGGFILSDNHGEIPFQVSAEIVDEISKQLQKYGKY